MPARDLYHNAVKNALIKDGWTITNDPLRLQLGRKDFYVDLGAGQFFAAEKDTQKIAVEVKKFSGASDIYNMQQALGQFMLYERIMVRVEPDRRLYLAINQDKWEELKQEEYVQLLLQDKLFRLIVVEITTEEVTQWIN